MKNRTSGMDLVIAAGCRRGQILVVIENRGPAVVELRTLPGIVFGGNQPLLKIIGVNSEGQADLFQIADAMNCVGLFLGHAHGRQEHRSKNADNGDDHQQLNECETAGAKISPTVYGIGCSRPLWARADHLTALAMV